MQPMQYYGSYSPGSIGNFNAINGLLSLQTSAQSNGIQVNKLNGAFDILMRNTIHR
jgi:hypothetical protein